MNAVEWADEKVSKLDAVDLALVKSSCLVGGVLMARLIPGLHKLDSRLLAAIALGLAAKPIKDVFADKRR